MTDTRKFRKLHAAATPTPWGVDYWDGVYSIESPGADVCQLKGSREMNPHNAELIAEAVNDLPALLDEAECLRAALDYAIQVIESYQMDIRAGAIGAADLTLVEQGFCQGSIYIGAVDTIRRLAASD